MDERIFVAKKPINLSSSSFLSRIKRKYNVKKAGYSGTLDPFASGVLIVAFGSFTRLFRFLQKEPKVYEATLWLGAKSETLDIEGIYEVCDISKREIDFLKDEIKGEIKFIPPKFSAKKIDGKRAYNLARSGQDVILKEQIMRVYEFEILSYNHPFLNFKASVSEGAYIRSLGEIIANKLGTFGSLSRLERLNEGKFYYENERALSSFEVVNLKENEYLGDILFLKLGKKLKVDDFIYKENGLYKVKFENFFAIIEIYENEVKYVLNRIKLCWY